MLKFGGSSVFFDLLLLLPKQRGRWSEEVPKIGAGVRPCGIHSLCTKILFKILMQRTISLVNGVPKGSSILSVMLDQLTLPLNTSPHVLFFVFRFRDIQHVAVYRIRINPQCSFSPTDSKFVSGSDDGTLRIWDFMRCQEERVLRGKLTPPQKSSTILYSLLIYRSWCRC